MFAKHEMSTYTIREVDGARSAVALELHRLHHETFGDSAPAIEPFTGHWWLVFGPNRAPVGFAGLTESTYGVHVGYLKRAGVLPAHRGHSLQRRLIAVREARARRNGWKTIITDTTDNPASANSLARAGYRMFTPEYPWAFDTTLYWRKDL